MEIKLFYKTQREIADVINTLVDGYWEHKLEEEIFIESVITIYKNNSRKILKDNVFTTILKQKCGKRRLEIISSILEENNVVINKTL